MHILKQLFTDKRSRSSAVTATLSLLLLISVTICMFQVTAWFQNHETVSTPGMVTSFYDTVQYNDGTSFVSVAAGQPIPVTLKDGEMEPIQVQIQHQGKSAAYLRVSLYGRFRNADTETVLPDMDGLWQFSVGDTKWIDGGDGYYYYGEKLSYGGATNSVADYKEPYTVSLDEFTVSIDSTKLSSAISAHQDYIGELYVIVDAVQPDRYPALWEINTLPFTL